MKVRDLSVKQGRHLWWRSAVTAGAGHVPQDGVWEDREIFASQTQDDWSTRVHTKGRKSLDSRGSGWKNVCWASTALVLALTAWVLRAHAITYASNDLNSPEASVVVRVQSQNGILCTGTLITPTAVLTAKHCVTGLDSSFDNPSPPAQLPFTVSVGTPLGPPIESAMAFTASVYGAYEPLNNQELGADLAILWLAQPLFTYAHIVRPTLASPVPADGDDGEGGIYTVPIGAAGWSPAPDHAANQRQVVLYTDDLKHFSGYPDGGKGTPSGQYWVHAQGHTGSLEPGDSGGPLFWQQPDGTRQVLGVADSDGVHFLGIDGFDCSFGRCDFWTDVTRDNTARWIRQQLRDTSRSPGWLAAHDRTEYWKGEVDYTGPCNLARDADCDHW
jgi:hypothetical protein